MNNNSKDIGLRIMKLREENSVSQEKLSEYLKIDRTSLSRLENGKRKISADEVKMVANYFNVSTDYILGNENTPKWATQKDVLDLKDFLDGNVGMAYDGEGLTKDEIERVNIALTQIFWEKRKQQKHNEK